MSLTCISARIGSEPRVLVLGSMPGAASLAAGQYYAHPRNLFWPLVETLFGIDREQSYPDRCDALNAAGVALWDVIARCDRNGSLDSAIDDKSVRANDFASLFRAHPSIRHVAFNGRKAAQTFERLVLPTLNEDRPEPHILPSTSPANASIPFATKLSRWRVLLDWLNSSAVQVIPAF